MGGRIVQRRTAVTIDGPSFVLGLSRGVLSMLGVALLLAVRP